MSELVSCPTLRVPAKARLDCTPAVGRGSDLQVCRLSCSAGSEFVTSPAGPTTGTAGAAAGNITTWCGTQTGYRWLHQLQNMTLPSCSGNSPVWLQAYTPPVVRPIYIMLFNAHLWPLIIVCWVGRRTDWPKRALAASCAVPW